MKGEEIKETLAHDAGAYGRCSYCGAYSENPSCLEDNHECMQCHLKNGFSGSFKKPTNDADWVY